MTRRISQKDLEIKVNRLNSLYKFGKGPHYVRLKNGKIKAKGKGFKLYGAYGRVALHYANFAKGTGESDISGLLTKKELYYVMQSIENVRYQTSRS